MTNGTQENQGSKALINVYDNELDLVRGLSKIIVDLAYVCQQHHGKFVAALSGGTTPIALYNMLATSEFASIVDWKKCYFFLSDERCVPDSDEASNFKMVNEHLFSKVPVPAENLFALVNPDKDPEEAARLYEEKIKQYCEEENGLPQFDMILLGLGEDGHTASLFPGSPALKEEKRLCVANRVDKLDADRITLTYPLLNNARNVYFLVKGDSKSEIVRSVLMENKSEYPASHVGALPPRTKEEQEEKDCAQTCTVRLCESNSTEWFLDDQAASKLISQSPTAS